ncbi:MAG: TetR/AcrR family transcriptional regulator, partial [Anaerolineae bacterium]
MTNKRKVDRRIRRTRKLLQIALISLLRRKPLEKIQIKEIVEEADVSRPTFYQHFATKETLLFSLMDDLFQKIHHVVFHERKEGEVLDVLQLLTLSYEQWLLHSEKLKWVLQVENKDLLIEALSPHIKSLKSEVDKHFPPPKGAQLYADYETSFVSGGMYMLIKAWIKNGMRESAETMGKITFLLLNNGLSSFRSLDSAAGAPSSTDLNSWQAVLTSLENDVANKQAHSS